MMFDFFYSGRRKAGCFLLVIAAALTASWIRSLDREERVWLHRIWLYHGNGLIGCCWLPEEYYLDLGPVGWGLDVYDRNHMGRKSGPLWEFESGIWSVAHRLLVCPLTILSAYLLLWPGKRKVKAPDDVGTEK